MVGTHAPLFGSHLMLFAILSQQLVLCYRRFPGIASDPPFITLWDVRVVRSSSSSFHEHNISYSGHLLRIHRLRVGFYQHSSCRDIQLNIPGTFNISSSFTSTHNNKRR